MGPNELEAVDSLTRHGFMNVASSSSTAPEVFGPTVPRVDVAVWVIAGFGPVTPALSSCRLTTDSTLLRPRLLGLFRRRPFCGWELTVILTFRLRPLDLLLEVLLFEPEDLTSTVTFLPGLLAIAIFWSSPPYAMHLLFCESSWKARITKLLSCSSQTTLDICPERMFFRQECREELIAQEFPME